jgi:phosphoribosylformylglycinamidine synthase
VKARVYVTLKSGVLDPAGKAVVHGLHALGYAEVGDVRIGKYFEIEVEDGPDAEARIAKMCRQLLANTVIEDFRVELGAGGGRG